jgi:hypothetical protein
MDEVKLNAIKKICINFRKAIREYSGCKDPVAMKYFPRGCCSITSYLLGAYFDENGFGVCNIVRAEKGDKSHAWLELEDIYIDLTLDQIDEFNDYYVGKSKVYDCGYTVTSCNTYKVSLDGNSIESDRLYEYYLEIKELL